VLNRVLQEEAIDRQLARMLSLIDRKHITTRGDFRPLDLAIVSQFLALDIVGDMTFGKPFGFLDEGEDMYDWVKWNEAFFPVAFSAATVPFLRKLSQLWPFTEFLPKPTDAVGLGRFIR
jgi:hypothetical protein